MSLNMKTLQQAFAKTAAVIEKTVQTTVQEVTGPKPLQDYELLTQIGSAGPGLIWKLYSAKPIRGSTIPQQYPTVTVWLLDKKAVSEARQRAGLSKAVEDAFYELIRGDAGRLVRLRHPGVVHVVLGLDENKNAMAMVTEPLFASVANALGKLENVAKVPNELKGMEIGLLEVKHGMLQIAESLDFLHNHAHLIHRAVSPENVLITSSGAWKLGGFGFAVSSTSSDVANGQAFHYAEYDVEDSLLPLQPSLNYTAPELVRNKSSSAGCVSDIFSFGCLAFHLITHKPLFDCKNNVKMYTNTLTYISTQTFSSIPVELVPDLQRMLSTNETSRPSAVEFTGSSFFRDDTRLRALRFLDHMLERDNIQKSEFLKALSDMWKDFDSRVLRYKVLPPLCAELRNVVMQPMVLPMVLTIAESQDKNDFELTTLPALVPVLSTAAGDTLLLLVKHADLIISKTSQEQLILHVLPFIVRAYDDTDARMQEEVLKKSISLAKQLDAQLVKQAILPRVHGLALKTTVATVRANALLCLGDLVHTLDKPAVLEILQTIQRCTAVDHSAPTLMCTLGVANAILKQYGVEFVAEHVLPLLVPLLIAQQLNVQQFAKYMLFVKDILRKIEEKRGVSVTDSGVPQMKPSVSADGLQSEALKRSSGNAPSTIKSSPSWDEDWGPPSKESNASKIISTSMPITVSSTSHQIQVTSWPPQSSMISASINQQSPQSVASVDIEWPPQPSSGVNQLPGITEKQNHDGGFPSSSSFDDLDPFANWPPRSSGLLNGPVSSSNGSAGAPASRYGSTSGLSTPNSWGFDNLTSIEPSRQTGSTLNSGSLNNMSLNSQSSIGFSKQTQGIYTSGTYFNDKKPNDLGSIFTSSKNEASAPKLAPPPATAVGRGRGRGRGISSVSRSGNARPPTEQTPIMDLL